MSSSISSSTISVRVLITDLDGTIVHYKEDPKLTSKDKVKDNKEENVKEEEEEKEVSATFHCIKFTIVINPRLNPPPPPT